MAKVKTKAFYHAVERDEFGGIVGRPCYEVRVSGKIDFDGNDYTDEEERLLIALCEALGADGFPGTVYESGAVWCQLDPSFGISDEKAGFKAVYDEWKAGL